MRFLLLTGLAASTAFAFFSGCGSSSSPDDAFSASDGGSDGSSSIVPDGASASSDGSSGLDGTASVVDGSPAPSPDANGGRFTDASPMIGSDGGAADDGGAGGSTAQVPCGTTTCALATDFCCVYQANNGPSDFVFGCATGSGCPQVANANDPTALLCSGAANCAPGSLCCVSDDGNRVWSECAASCAPPAGGGTATAQLCDPAAAQTGCSTSAACSSNKIDDWNLPNGYATCGGMGN